MRRLQQWGATAVVRASGTRVQRPLRWLVTHARRVLLPKWWFLLRGTEPASRRWGFDRGTPVDRPYIEAFLAQHRSDITGRVLEVKAAQYTQQLGTAISSSDVLDLSRSNPQATIVADLASGEGVPVEAFDCFVLTQTLQLIYDVRAAVETAHRALRPGGVLLATVPGISQLAPVDDEALDFWRFTPAACKELFEASFGPGAVVVSSYGNYRTAAALLAGLAREELAPSAYDRHDRSYPVIVAVRARKLGGTTGGDGGAIP